MNERAARIGLVWWVIILIVVIGSVLWISLGKEQREETIGYFPETHFPEIWATVSPSRCQPCHEAIVEAWQQSQHAMANRPMDGTEVAPFVSLLGSAGAEYHPEADPWPRIEGSGNPEVPYGNVVGQIGVTPLVQYLVTAEKGRWQAHELAVETSTGEWFNIYGEEGRYPGEWGHWSGQGMNWNSNCAWCHMTKFRKHYEPQTDSYASTWVAHGVSCLQCHAHSAEHVLAMESGGYASADSGEPDAMIAMDNCATCHARRESLTPDGFVAGDHFSEHFRLTLPDVPGVYFPDGQNLDENYVYGSLMLSRMGHAGVTCADCHDPHSSGLILPVENNALCMRCHEVGLQDAPVIDPTAHSHHASNSTGNRCIECHMPERTYMGRDARRDHGFTSPDPRLSLELGTPNACAQCHTDKPFEWVVEHADGWYASEKREARRGRARLLAHAYDPTTTFPTAALQQAIEATDEDYWKATYLRLLAQSPEAPQLRYWVAPYFEEKNPIVRAGAARLLGASGIGEGALSTLLGDPSRQVRMEAVDGLSRRSGVLPTAALADQELYLEANTDRPEGALRSAARFLSEDNLSEALRDLKRAISFDSANPALYFQSALLLDGGGKVDEALSLLQLAPESVRKSGLIYYGEGLLWAEKGDSARAVSRLRLAVEKDPGQVRWWYNYALALTRVEGWVEAESAARQALALEPENEEVRYLVEYIRANKGT